MRIERNGPRVDGEGGERENLRIHSRLGGREGGKKGLGREICAHWLKFFNFISTLINYGK